jgi:hypothetical protein
VIEKELLSAIRNDFIEKSGEDAKTAVEQFCSFANTWLVSRGVVGLGQTTDGFAIRFADGSEYILAANTREEPQPGAPLSITGMESRNQRVMPDTTRSFNITGR